MGSRWLAQRQEGSRTQAGDSLPVEGAGAAVTCGLWGWGRAEVGHGCSQVVFSPTGPALPLLASPTRSILVDSSPPSHPPCVVLAHAIKGPSTHCLPTSQAGAALRVCVSVRQAAGPCRLCTQPYSLPPPPAGGQLWTGHWLAFAGHKAIQPRILPTGCLWSSRRDRLPTPLTTEWYKTPLDENQEARTSGRHNAF